MGRLFILSGSSACGKTTLMNSVLKEAPEIAVVQKYGTRRRRAAEDGVQDDLCQIFDAPFPETIDPSKLLREADGFISDIWREGKNGLYRVKKSAPPKRQSVFCKLVGEPDYFDLDTQIASQDLLSSLVGALRRFYDEEGGLLKIKATLSDEEKRRLSFLLEDLEVRTPVIAVGKDKFWDDLGEVVPIAGTIDIAYALNKGQYGISSESIRAELEAGRDVVTILSDFRVINRMKEIFHESVVAVYVASAVDTARLEKIQIGRLGIDPASEYKLKSKLERLNASVDIGKWGNVAKWIHELNADWRDVKPDAEGTEFRAERIKTFHTRYIDNINLFNHVVLNYTEGRPEDMTSQFLNIMAAAPRKGPGRAPLFVVCAASNAGKGTMMEMMNLIGSDRIKILSKVAKRRKKRNDKKDGMVPIGTPQDPLGDESEYPGWWSDEMVRAARGGHFPLEYDFTWSFHGKSVEYAVSDQEIRRNLDEGEAQIVISNTDQIERFVERYGDDVVFVLLYRLSSIEDTRDYYEFEEGLSPREAESRANEVEQVLQEYIKKISHFSHVILNTTRPQDMYDQMFQLVEFYV